MECKNPDCDSGKASFALGYCQPCYHRMRRNGSLERRYVHGGSSGMCSTEGCDRHAISKGLCGKHYQQSQHPLSARWKIMKSRSMGDHVPEWNSFEQFVADVGDAPGLKYQLRRADIRRPWGPDNVEWREPLSKNAKSGTTANMANYQRAYYYLRKFGLREEDITRMRAEQNDRCPICSLPLEVTHPDTGKVIRICVDHDHRTKKIRGLLHDHCNKALGHFDDNIEAMRAAIAYLEHHLAEPA